MGFPLLYVIFVFLFTVLHFTFLIYGFSSVTAEGGSLSSLTSLFFSSQICLSWFPRSKWTTQRYTVVGVITPYPDATKFEIETVLFFLLINPTDFSKWNCSVCGIHFCFSRMYSWVECTSSPDLSIIQIFVEWTFFYKYTMCNKSRLIHTQNLAYIWNQFLRGQDRSIFCTLLLFAFLFFDEDTSEGLLFSTQNRGIWCGVLFNTISFHLSYFVIRAIVIKSEA